jgi:hypothetical protein
MPLNPTIVHFAEAIAVWCACLLLFVLIIALRRVWIRHAKTARAAARASNAAALDLDAERPGGEGPVE